MKRFAILTLALFPPLAFGQHDSRDWRYEEQETIRRSFDVPGGSGKLLVDNVSGYIHVTGYGGSQVQVSVEKHVRARSSEALQEAKRDVRLDISQQGNFVRLYVDGPFRTGSGTNYRGEDYYGYRVDFDYDLQVPYATEVDLHTINHGDIQVKQTSGDFNIHGLNGGITMEEVSGSGSVKTLNGPVRVTFSKNPARNTEFKTLNGELEIYFQPGLDADLQFKKLNGGIYADFDVTLGRVGETSRDSEGKFVYREGRNMSARAGRGGPLLSFDTLNGSIRLHSKTF